MNKKDLDALNELYLSVYGGEQLNEAPGGKARFWDSNLGRFVANTGRTAGDIRDVLYGDPSGPASRDARQRLTQRVTGQPVKEYPDQRAARISRAQDKAIADAEKSEKPNSKPTAKPTLTDAEFDRKYGTNDPKNNLARPETGKPRVSSPASAARPSGPVLSKKNGVEGTGVGANFKARAFTAAEKSRYASVAAQNAAKSSASSGTPKPSPTTPAASAPKPAVGKLGNTSFERRTPTSAELRAAQAERATQKASGQDTSSVKNAEKALQAAQKTNLPTTGPSVDLATAKTSIESDKAKFTPRDMNKYPIKTPNPINNTKPSPTMKSSYEWPSAKTIRDIADAYALIYEAKKKDQDQDGDNDFADIRIARMIASGVPKEVAIAKVRGKSYNEEVEIDEATRMRKELGKEGEIETRQELARRSKAFKRSGSVDKTIAAAERGADRPYIKHKRDESDADRKKREETQSRTLRGLAASRRGSVRDTPRVELRGYAAKVEGSDKDLQRARSSAMSAGTLTPKEKKQLGEEYQIYEIVASYLLENNFAETLNDANVIIENMSENWLEEILEQSAIASRAAKVVDDQRQGYHGDSDAINKLQDATSKSIGKLKRGQGPVVTPGMPVRGV